MSSNASRKAKRLGLLKDALSLPFTDANKITALILAESRGVPRKRRRRDIPQPAPASQRHLRQRYQQAAPGDIVDGGHRSGLDKSADEIAGLAFGSEIHGWRRTLKEPRCVLLI